MLSYCLNIYLSGLELSLYVIEYLSTRIEPRSAIFLRLSLRMAGFIAVIIFIDIQAQDSSDSISALVGYTATPSLRIIFNLRLS